MGVVSLIKNIFKPGYFKVIAKKVIYRFESSSVPRADYLSWYEANSKSLNAYGSHLDTILLHEAEQHDRDLNDRSDKILSTIPLRLGGGGFSTLLYYLVRKIKPAIVIETGVAAGFSSQAILKALSINRNGQLFSSDFPYFREDGAEKYIGVLVEPDLRKNWTLLTKGDEVNIPVIIQHLNGRKIDILHYDSDKSYTGRVNAMKMVLDHCHSSSWLMFDDINDNSHFKDFVEKGAFAFRIFKVKRKYIGVVNLNKSLVESMFPASGQS